MTEEQKQGGRLKAPSDLLSLLYLETPFWLSGKAWRVKRDHGQRLMSCLVLEVLPGSCCLFNFHVQLHKDKGTFMRERTFLGSKKHTETLKMTFALCESLWFYSAAILMTGWLLTLNITLELWLSVVLRFLLNVSD